MKAVKKSSVNTDGSDKLKIITESGGKVVVKTNYVQQRRAATVTRLPRAHTHNVHSLPACLKLVYIGFPLLFLLGSYESILYFFTVTNICFFNNIILYCKMIIQRKI